MGQWKYKIITTTHPINTDEVGIVRSVDGFKLKIEISIIEALNLLGKDGWELVQVITKYSDGTGSNTVYFEYIMKRFINEIYIGETPSKLSALRHPQPPPSGKLSKDTGAWIEEYE